jgi:hypothetical protein
MRLIPLPHHKPLALLLIEIELRDSHSFRRRLDRPEVVGALAAEGDAPRPELRGFPLRWCSHATGRIGQRRQKASPQEKGPTP